MAPDFWPSSAYRSLAITRSGALQLTDDFLRSLLSRAELAPIPESCDREIALHDSLMRFPRSEVPTAQLLLMQDLDAQDNYRVFMRFRERLLASDTIEEAYVRLFQGSGVDVPPIFVFQLTQIFLRHILNEANDPLETRMAECLFRVQKISMMDDGSVMAADYETIETFAQTGGFGSLGEMLRKQNTPLRSVDLDVLSTENASTYWDRDERFDFAVSLNRGQPTIDALCRVLEKWIYHFLNVRVTIKPKREIDDERWSWHVGMDATASSILNDLYNRRTVESDRMKRLLCLFELTFGNPSEMRHDLAGKPIYLAMAMDENNQLKLKPQNLLLNLPLTRA